MKKLEVSSFHLTLKLFRFTRKKKSFFFVQNTQEDYGTEEIDESYSVHLLHPK